MSEKPFAEAVEDERGVFRLWLDGELQGGVLLDYAQAHAVTAALNTRVEAREAKLRGALADLIRDAGQLVFECDGVVGTRMPSRPAYNTAWETLNRSRAVLTGEGPRYVDEHEHALLMNAFRDLRVVVDALTEDNPRVASEIVGFLRAMGLTEAEPPDVTIRLLRAALREGINHMATQGGSSTSAFRTMTSAFDSTTKSDLRLELGSRRSGKTHAILTTLTDEQLLGEVRRRGYIGRLDERPVEMRLAEEQILEMQRLEPNPPPYVRALPRDDRRAVHALVTSESQEAPLCGGAGSPLVSRPPDWLEVTCEACLTRMSMFGGQRARPEPAALTATEVVTRDFQRQQQTTVLVQRAFMHANLEPTEERMNYARGVLQTMGDRAVSYAYLAGLLLRREEDARRVT